GLAQGRPASGSRPHRRLSDRLVRGEEIVAPDANTRDAIRRGAFRDAGARHLEPLRDGDRPVVVLAEKNHRTLMDGGEVQAFMKIALARRALAKAHVTERPLAAPFQSQADAGGLGDLRADCAGPDDDAAAATSEISRRLAPAARWVGGPGKGRQHQLLRREAAGKSGGEVSIVKTEAIAARVEGGDGRHLSDLRSEEHTSELQSPCDLVCRLL